MKIKTIRSSSRKDQICGIVFIIGMTLGGALFSALGFQTLEAPEGTDVKTIGMWFLLDCGCGYLLSGAVSLSRFSRNLQLLKNQRLWR
jgi:hypothetical protein